MGGALTGFRANAAIIDDSLNAADARSKAVRDSTNLWFDSALSTRLDDPDSASIIVIQQRLHSDDLIGHLLEIGGWEHLSLPAEFNPARCTTTSIWQDPRTTEGELLAPSIHSRTYLDEQRRVLGSAGYSCQYQQAPVDDEGNLFRRDWWRFHKPDGTAPISARRPHGTTELPAVPVPPGDAFDEVIISLDSTFKGGEENDYVVALVIGCRMADRFVLDMRRAKLDFTATLKLVRELSALYPFARFLIEDTANGPAVISALAREVSGLIAVKPEGGKESRASAISPQVESGNVFLPEGAAWLDDFIDECASFPRGKHDDIVDALSQALHHAHVLTADMLRAIALCNLGSPLGDEDCAA